jgi:hypothetical protein
MNDFYVYGHFKGNVCMYVGAGREHRAWAFNKRSKRWFKEFVSPPEVRILLQGLSQDQASEKEIEILAEYRAKGQATINCTRGGEKGIAWSRGKNLSTEHKLAISGAKKGKPNGLEGRKWSEAHKHKISESRRNSEKVKLAGAKIWETRRLNGTAQGFTTAKARAVRCVDTGEIFRTAREAAEKISGSDKHIQACCVGRRATHKKLRWEYV